MPDKRPARSFLPLILLLAIFTGGAWFLASEWQSATEVRGETTHAHQLVEATTTLVKEIVDAETGQRGFALSADPAYLTPFDAAAISVPERLTLLGGLVGDGADQRRRVERLEELWAERIALMRAAIDRRRAGGPAWDAAGEARGKAVMDEIRAEADRLQSVERTALTERIAAADRSRQRLGTTIAVLLGLAGIGMAVSVVMLARRTRTLARDVVSQRQIARSLEEATFDLAGKVSSAEARLAETAWRLDAALRTAPLVITSQDRDLRYVWMRNALAGHAPDWFIGRTEEEALTGEGGEAMRAAKLAVLASGEPADIEVQLPAPGDPEGGWYDVHIEPIRGEAGAIDGVTATLIEVTDRKRREGHIRLLMRELAHRSKNTLAVTQAMARQTAAASGSMEEFLDRFADRLEALGRAHTLLAHERWSGAAIADLARSQLGHYADLIGRQVFLDGPPLTLPADMIQHIGLALHELATNAAKYGALSTPQGRVDVTWTAENDADGSTLVTILWQESGGPAVEPPSRRGFGRNVIERTVARAVSGEVSLDYRREGVVWRLTFRLPPSSDHSAATA